MKNYLNIETVKRGAYASKSGNFLSWYIGYTSTGQAVRIHGECKAWRAYIPYANKLIHGATLAEISEKLKEV